MNELSNTSPIVKIEFSNEELWCLLGLYAPTTIVGVENPYLGNLIEETRNHELAALQSLFARNIINIKENNSLELAHSMVKAMIETCLKPEHCLWLTVSQNARQKSVAQRLVYFSAALIVHIALEGGHTYSLTAVSDTEALIELLTEFLSPIAQEKGASSNFILEETVFDTAMNVFDSGDDQTGIQILSKAGINDSSIKELKSAMGEEGITMLSIYIKNPLHPEICHIQGLGYLNGKMGGWLLHQYEQNGSEFVHFQPGTSKEFRELVFSLVK